jgi:hypothetical protein
VESESGDGGAAEEEGVRKKKRAVQVKHEFLSKEEQEGKIPIPGARYIPLKGETSNIDVELHLRWLETGHGEPFPMVEMVKDPAHPNLPEIQKPGRMTLAKLRASRAKLGWHGVPDEPDFHIWAKLVVRLEEARQLAAVCDGELHGLKEELARLTKEVLTVEQHREILMTTIERTEVDEQAALDTLRVNLVNSADAARRRT